MSDAERKRRAEARRQKMTVRRARLADAAVDIDPVTGEQAISLVTRLTRECWSLGGLPLPVYARSEIPVRFVPRAAG